jgi:putative flippase GtrA
MHALLGRLARDQRVRFLAVGATNTVVGYLVFSAFTLWVFADVHLGYLLSLALSYVIGITLAFVLYRRFVFPVHGHLLRDFARFVSVYLVAIGINAAALPLLVEVAQVPPLLAQLMILVVTTLLSFFGHKKFSFRRSGSEAAPND